MNKLSNSHHFHLPEMFAKRPSLELSPIYAEDDELIQDIDADRRENTWRLDAMPDPDELREFWDNVSIDD